MNRRSFIAPAALIGSAFALAITAASFTAPATAQDMKLEKCSETSAGWYLSINFFVRARWSRFRGSFEPIDKLTP